MSPAKLAFINIIYLQVIITALVDDRALSAYYISITLIRFCTYRQHKLHTLDPIPCFTAETTQVRLMIKNTPRPSYIGKVQHFFNTTWHTVCDGNWTDLISNSNVLCKQLGLGHAVEHWLHNRDETDTSFLHTHMNCNGTEDADRLTLCKHNFSMDDTCSGKSVP